MVKSPLSPQHSGNTTRMARSGTKNDGRRWREREIEKGERERRGEGVGEREGEREGGRERYIHTPEYIEREESETRREGGDTKPLTSNSQTLGEGRA